MNFYIQNQTVVNPQAQAVLTEMAAHPDRFPMLRTHGNRVDINAQGMQELFNLNRQGDGRDQIDQDDVIALSDLLHAGHENEEVSPQDLQNIAALFAEYQRIVPTTGPRLVSHLFDPNGLRPSRVMSPASSTASLAPIHFNSVAQRLTLQHLHGFLNRIHFDAANQRIHPHSYSYSPVYDTQNTLGGIRGSNASPFESDPRLRIQNNALRFLMYGEAINEQQARELFASAPGLFEELKSLNLVVETQSAGQAVQYRMNALSLTSQRLPNGQVMYLFMDAPEHISGSALQERTAQLSSTSYILLHQLMEDYLHHNPLSGRIADMGSGIGIQSIALLKLYPHIQTAFAVEIDDHSLNISRLNALLNGVQNRFVGVDNHDPQNLARLLGRNRLDYVVSNPPFNAMPRYYAEQFTDFGDGGPDGLAVTRIFLNQALPLLREGGEFLMYSVLVVNENQQVPLYQNLLARPGLRVEANPLGIRDLNVGVSTYGVMFSRYLRRHGHNEVSPEAFTRALQADHVARFQAAMVRILRRSAVQTGIRIVGEVESRLGAMVGHYNGDGGNNGPVDPYSDIPISGGTGFWVEEHARSIPLWTE
ncbi:MAG: methyltransferase [Deltaproteobacteria bacterium]|nr:methyltransferase [Deltaproteobacteria bacterium]